MQIETAVREETNDECMYRFNIFFGGGLFEVYEGRISL